MKCYIDNKVWQKMQYYIQNIDAEISGLGKTEIIDDDIYVRDIEIFNQEVTGSTTDLCHDSRNKFLTDLIARKEDPSQWNLWWHSHNTMAVFWSGTDETAIKNDIGKIPFLLSIVSNKKKEIKTRIDFTLKSDLQFCNEYSQSTLKDVETIILPVLVSGEGYNDYKKQKDVVDVLEKKVNTIEEELDKFKKKLEEESEDLNTLIEEFEYDEELEKKCIKEIAEKVIEKSYKILTKKELKKTNDEEYYESKYLKNKNDRFDFDNYFKGLGLRGEEFDYDDSPSDDYPCEDLEFYINEEFKQKINLIKNKKYVE